MAYPDKLLAEDEEVVSHLHPHWLTVFWPVVWFLLIVGAASFGAALVPGGPDRGTYRLAIVVVALLLALFLVGGPLLRWRTTHYVITTHRVLWRVGVLSRTGRDVGLSRITDVSYRQTLWERLTRSGTVAIDTAGEGTAVVLQDIPDSQGVQQLIAQLVEEDAERRSSGWAGSGWAAGHPTTGWNSPGEHPGGWDDGAEEQDGDRQRGRGRRRSR